MINLILIILGNLIAYYSKLLNLGHGSTWPGHVALSINKYFIKELIKANPHLKIILIAGTNGKTTTGRLIQTILENANYKVFQNESGANLLNGIASSLLLHSSILCKINYDYAIFEVDEATLPLALKEIAPDYLILLNLFRDQLDRYGEVNTIINKWAHAIRHLLPKTKLILNADDPQIAYLGGRHSGEDPDLSGDDSRIRPSPHSLSLRERTSEATELACLTGVDRVRVRVLYFGLNDKKFAVSKQQHAADSTYCPNCNSKLRYNSIYYSHLGDWMCNKCLYKRPNLDLSRFVIYPLYGTYNRYNVHAAVLIAKIIGLKEKQIEVALQNFKPSFGRQEILNFNGKKVQIFLSKNPTSFNESLRTVADLKAKNVLFVLNDRIPDGRDVSWIWDVDFEGYVDAFKSITVSGDRCYDMALRLKYAVQSSKFNPFDRLRVDAERSHAPSGAWRSRSIKVQSYLAKRDLASQDNSKLKVYEDLKKAIAEGTRLISSGGTLYVLPTYSAMLEVRKILTGKKLL